MILFADRPGYTVALEGIPAANVPGAAASEGLFVVEPLGLCGIGKPLTGLGPTDIVLDDDVPYRITANRGRVGFADHSLLLMFNLNRIVYRAPQQVKGYS